MPSSVPPIIPPSTHPTNINPEEPSKKPTLDATQRTKIDTDAVKNDFEHIAKVWSNKIAAIFK